MEYGDKAWFEHMFSRASQGEDLWGHQWRPIQQYRYLLSLSLVSERLKSRDEQRVLDLGCGLGDFTAMMHGENPRNVLLGTDIAETAIVAARERFPALQFATGTLPQIDDPGPFDGIAALECINYLAPADRQQAMRSVASRLKASGWFLFSGHLSRNSKDRRYFSEADVFSCMREAGFEVAKVIYNYAVLYNIFETPFVRVVNLSSRLYAWQTGEETPSGRGVIVARALKMPVLGAMLAFGIRVGAALCKGMLRFLQPVALIRMFQGMSRRLPGDRGKSHIILLAVKASADAKD